MVSYDVISRLILTNVSLSFVLWSQEQSTWTHQAFILELLESFVTLGKGWGQINFRAAFKSANERAHYGFSEGNLERQKSARRIDFYARDLWGKMKLLLSIPLSPFLPSTNFHCFSFVLFLVKVAVSYSAQHIASLSKVQFVLGALIVTDTNCSCCSGLEGSHFLKWFCPQLGFCFTSEVFLCRKYGDAVKHNLIAFFSKGDSKDLENAVVLSW